MKGVTSRPLMNYGFFLLDAPLLYIQVLSKKLFPHLKRKNSFKKAEF